MMKLSHWKTTSFRTIVMAILLCGSSAVWAQNYPFTLPDTVIATLDVQTASKEEFKNAILGYNIFGFEAADEKTLINAFDPTTMRFPHGLYANWYDWRTDGTRVFGTETFDYIHRGADPKETEIGELNAINTFDRMNKKIGINGLTVFNTAKKSANQGQGYDVVWTFNMSADGADFDNGSPESVAWYEDLISRGFEVKVIEMGNECFYPGQRSSIIPNDAQYIARAKSMYAALKAKDSTIQLSIPLLRRGSWVNPDWNVVLTKDMDYFDAITVHTYIGSDPDNAENSDEAYSTALTARKSLASSTNDFVRPYSGDKPIWLTEWGVKSGGPNAASVLGMADCYLFMAENQDVYHRANWFSVNGKLNSFVVWENYTSNGATKSRIKYPLQKTAYGSTHEILKEIFENSTMLEGTITTSELESGVNAVTARAVTQNGVTTVFTVNLTDKPAVFNLNIDGKSLTKQFLHEAMSFDNVGQERNLDIDVSPLSTIKDGQGEIILPPLSLNKITIKGDPIPVEYLVNFESPMDGAKMEVDTNLVVKATAGSAVTGVSLFLDNALVRTITNAPYTWGEDTIIDAALSTMTVGYHKLKLVATNADTASIADSITIEVMAPSMQSPYAGIIAIPGQFEAEDYDLGGEGIAYHDSDDNNQTGEYRTDGVDIGLGGSGYTMGYSAANEWLEYTIDVAEDGQYDLVINYASGRPGGGAKIAASLPDEDIVFVQSFDLPVTGSWSDYQEISIGEISLTKGKHIIRLTVVDRGFNLDWIEIEVPEISGTNDTNASAINVYPNPSASGVFQLSEHQTWEVYSLTGKRVLRGEGTQVDLSAFPKGMYVLRSEILICKIIKE